MRPGLHRPHNEVCPGVDPSTAVTNRVDSSQSTLVTISGALGSAKTCRHRASTHCATTAPNSFIPSAIRLPTTAGAARYHPGPRDEDGFRNITERNGLVIANQPHRKITCPPSSFRKRLCDYCQQMHRTPNWEKASNSLMALIGAPNSSTSCPQTPAPRFPDPPQPSDGARSCCCGPIVVLRSGPRRWTPAFTNANAPATENLAGGPRKPRDNPTGSSAMRVVAAG